MAVDTSGTMALAAEFAQLERAWADAVVRQDRAVLEGLLAPDYALVVSAAPDRPVRRATWLEQAVGPYRMRSYQIDALMARPVADGLVAVNLLLTIEASVSGVDRSVTFFIVDVWRRAENGWQVVLRYSSRPEDASASSRAVTGE